MKKIFDRQVMIKIDGWEEFEDTSIFRHLTYTNEELGNTDFSYRFETFEEAKKAVEEGWIMNAESTTTFFKKRPLLKFSTANRDCSLSITEKNFEPIEVKIMHVEESGLSIRTIADLLTANEFCEYLKDRAISSIKL